MGADSEPLRLRRGEPDAFEALLARYQNRLYRYLLRLTANRAVAEDLFQETWLRVITRIHLYDERRPFEPWLFRVASGGRESGLLEPSPLTGQTRRLHAVGGAELADGLRDAVADGALGQREAGRDFRPAETLLSEPQHLALALR